MPVTLHTTQGNPFTVDEEDAPLLERHSWALYHRQEGGAVEGIYCCLPGTRKAINLRLLIMGPPPARGHLANSIDGDPLRLEKQNLAWLDPGTQTHRNARPINQGGYRGIKKTKAGTWCFRVGKDRKTTSYPNPLDAAQGYDEAAREIYGPWARLNFPDAADPVPPGLSFPASAGMIRADDGQTLQVDPEALPLLSRHAWHKGPNGYWMRLGPRRIPLAFLVLGSPKVKRAIEFKDGDSRNCRLENLQWKPLREGREVA